MRTFGRHFSRFEDWLTTQQRTRFKGTILPAPDNVSANQIIETRLLLRVRPNEPIQEGVNITDAAGRVFLVGRDDTQLDANAPIARTFRLFRMTQQISWTRAATKNDPITNLPTRASFTEMGPIWCAVEPLGQIATDLGTRMPAEIHRVITGAAVQLHDNLAGRVVKRIIPVFGITIAETE